MLRPASWILLGVLMGTFASVALAGRLPQFDMENTIAFSSCAVLLLLVRSLTDQGRGATDPWIPAPATV